MSGSGLAARWMKETLTKTSFLPPRKGDRNAVAAKRHQGATGPRPKVGVQARGPPKSRYSGRSTGLTEAPHAPRAGGALGPREQGRKKEGAPARDGHRGPASRTVASGQEKSGQARALKTKQDSQDKEGQERAVKLRPSPRSPDAAWSRLALPCSGSGMRGQPRPTGSDCRRLASSCGSGMTSKLL